MCGRALPGGCSSRRHSSEVQSSQRVIRAKTDAQTQLIAHLPSLADGWAYWGYGMDSMDKTATLLQVARKQQGQSMSMALEVSLVEIEP